MFRLIRDAVARLAGPFTVSPSDDGEPAPEVRIPDPCVRPLPNPYDARWRRWHKRSRAAGRYLPMPLDDDCRQVPRPPGPPAWQSDDCVVRPYVLGP